MMQNDGEKLKSRIFCFLCAVLAGCIVANILLRLDRNLQAYVIPFVESEHFKQVTLKETFFYVLFQRLKQFVILLLLYKVFPAKYIFTTVVTALLCLFGFTMSCQMYYMGWNGVCYMILCLFPHYLIYLLLLGGLAGRQKMGEYVRNKSTFIVIAFGIFLLGVCMESFLSKIFLKNFLQYIGY